VVRRTRLTDRRQAPLWPNWRHFGFLTDLGGDAVSLDEFHRHHAVVELTIRDLKDGAGMDHVPSGNFSANSAWLQCAVLANNLIRWTATIGEPGPAEQLTVARTVRTRLIALPGRLVTRAGTITLRGPLNWPWADWFNHRHHGLTTPVAVRRAADNTRVDNPSPRPPTEACVPDLEISAICSRRSTPRARIHRQADTGRESVDRG
jgi:hypothetical protein